VISSSTPSTLYEEDNIDKMTEEQPCSFSVLRWVVPWNKKLPAFCAEGTKEFQVVSNEMKKNVKAAVLRKLTLVEGFPFPKPKTYSSPTVGIEMS
jgi:hypothetical protein